MAALRVLVLGAGFGGLQVASRLSDAAAGRVDVTLIDSSDAFVFGFSKLDVMFGRATLADVRTPYRSLDKPGVTFRQETVIGIDPQERRGGAAHGRRAAGGAGGGPRAALPPGAPPGPPGG